MDIDGSARKRRNEAEKDNEAQGDLEINTPPKPRAGLAGRLEDFSHRQGLLFLALAVLLGALFLAWGLGKTGRNRFEFMMMEKELYLLDKGTGTIFVKNSNPSPTATLPVWKPVISSLDDSLETWKTQGEIPGN